MERLMRTAAGLAMDHWQPLLSRGRFVLPRKPSTEPPSKFKPELLDAAAPTLILRRGAWSHRFTRHL